MSGLSVSDALRSFISTPVHEAGAEPSDFAQEEKRPLIVNIRGTAHVYSCYVRGCDAVATKPLNNDTMRKILHCCWCLVRGLSIFSSGLARFPVDGLWLACSRGSQATFELERNAPSKLGALRRFSVGVACVLWAVGGDWGRVTRSSPRARMRSSHMAVFLRAVYVDV